LINSGGIRPKPVKKVKAAHQKETGSMSRTPRSIVKRRVAFLLCCALLWGSTPVAAEWPVTAFDLFQGRPLDASNSIVSAAARSVADYGEFEFPSSRPMNPTLEAEVERYLEEVAGTLEKDFPPPQWNAPMTRKDGVPALRLYYYDFPSNEGPDREKTDNTEIARYVSDCGDGPDSIHINARTFLSNQNTTQLTAKNYSDLAHELFHAVQAATEVGKVHCARELGHWVKEGQAEAFGHDMARQLRGKSGANNVTRWGLRNYHTPLYAARWQSGGKDQSYQTSSFWRYLAERHALRMARKSGASAMPGPDLPNGYKTDYSYLAGVLDIASNGTGPRAEMEWIDVALQVEFDRTLREIYSEFITVFADYGAHRMQKARSDDRDKWIGFALSEKQKRCPKLTLDLAPGNRDHRLRVPVAENAATCVQLEVGETKGPQTWVVQTKSPDASLTRQLALGLAGGQQLFQSAILDAGTDNGALAFWPFDLDPKQTHYLVISNIADVPGNTVAQTVDVRISLPGHQSPTLPSSPPKSRRRHGGSTPPAPGPAGAEEAKRQRMDRYQPGPNGLAAAGWSRKEPRGCGRGYSAMDCQGGAVIALGLSAGLESAMLPGGVPNGGLMGDIAFMAGMMDVTDPEFMADMMAWETWSDETPRTSLTLRIPGVDYGFTGSVSQVGVTLSGAESVNERYAISTRPQAAWSPCSYNPPTGTVVIEEFSRELIRGRYSAPLAERPKLRLGYRERCPTLSVVERIEGEFQIAAPWLDDDRAVDMSWIESTMVGDLGQMIPGFDAMDLPGPPPRDAGAGPAGGDGGYERDPLDELGDLIPEDCDCSCTAQEKSRAVVENMTQTGQLPQDGDVFKALMCAQLCLMSEPGCF
jgi:hypothetical protein